MKLWKHYTDALVATGVIGIVFLLIIPLPPFLLDTLLCFSLVLAVMTLLLTLYVENILEFSAFPSLLLFLTLFRLSLNIASTRMILTRGEAGDIIETFGEFVIQGAPFVGLVLFALLTTMNFIVVTKGAGRVAEVSARFTLEALPGKQMAIENDVSAGLCTQAEAKALREDLNSEAEFYGAMDGASKFVRGDAIAGVIIVLLNIVGGLIVGVMKNGFSWEESFHLFTRLTIGDGLVTQIPALLISVGAGIIVTRASGGSLTQTLPQQFFRNSKVLMIAGGALLLLSFIPGMPPLIMVPIALGLLALGYTAARKHKTSKATAPKQEESLESALFIPLLEIQLGYQLTAMGEPLLKRIPEMRRQTALRWGIVLPSISVRDESNLSPKSYLIKIKGVSVAKGRGSDLESLEMALIDTIENHLHELINRQDVTVFIEKAKEIDAAVVAELIPSRVKIGDILRILQNLLKERIPIRNFLSILEMLANYPLEGEMHHETVTEFVRGGLAKGISEHFFGESKIAHAITLDPKVEQMLQVSLQKGAYRSHLVLRPITAAKIQETLQELFNRAHHKGINPIVIVSESARRPLRHLVEKELPKLPILAFGEVAEDVEIRTLGMVSQEVLI